MSTRTYKTTQGDTWDSIAYSVYGSEKYMGYLMENNLRYIDFTVFPPGIKLNVPDLPEENDEDIPDWRIPE